jgi:nicotinic acid phosphoribosyltransferase
MYPDAQEMRVYGTFRQKYPGITDDRIVVYGIKHYISQFISRKITDQDIQAGSDFLKGHLVNYLDGKPIPLEEKGSDYFALLKKNHNYPVKIEALPEGSVIRPGIPAYIITAKDENSRLCAFLETMLTMIWYPSTVATLSRHTKTLIEKAFLLSVVEPAGKYQALLDTRLHDFRLRGCTCVEHGQRRARENDRERFEI